MNIDIGDILSLSLIAAVITGFFGIMIVRSVVDDMSEKSLTKAREYLNDRLTKKEMKTNEYR